MTLLDVIQTAVMQVLNGAQLTEVPSMPRCSMFVMKPAAM